MRKYAAIPLNNEYHSEMGLRILLGKAARDLAGHEKGMQPLLSHATRHYVRTYLKLKKGATAANKSIDQLGFVIHCPDCGHRQVRYGLAVSLPDNCNLCGSSVQIAGPLWLGPLHNKEFCDEVLREMDRLPLGTRERAKKILTLCKEELDIPFFYDQHLICKKMVLSAPAMDVFITKLKESGFKVSRTHFSGTSFKTDASIVQIKDVLRSLSM
jgi:tRNA (guanine26-N2/guanine27-N2)-dimethyltransferase